jgi:hypothetical protein
MTGQQTFQHDQSEESPMKAKRIRSQQRLAQNDARTRNIVREHGWMIQAVFGKGTDPPFAYTVGLFGLDHPELVIFGIDEASAAGVLNHLGERVRQGDCIAPGELLTFDHWPHRLHVFPLPNPSEVLFAANRFYHRPPDDPVPALQLVWDDLWGNFPWEPGYQAPAWCQPVPGSFKA